MDGGVGTADVRVSVRSEGSLEISSLKGVAYPLFDLVLPKMRSCARLSLPRFSLDPHDGDFFPGYCVPLSLPHGEARLSRISIRLEQASTGYCGNIYVKRRRVERQQKRSKQPSTSNQGFPTYSCNSDCATIHSRPAVGSLPNSEGYQKTPPN